MIHAFSRSPRSVLAAATDFTDSLRIHEDVEKAAQRYEESRSRLQLLISAIKEQHSLMLETSEKRLRTAKQFDIFLENTPLSKMVSEVDSSEAKSKVFNNVPPKKLQGTNIPLETSTSGPPGEDESNEAAFADSRHDEASEDGRNQRILSRTSESSFSEEEKISSSEEEKMPEIKGNEPEIEGNEPEIERNEPEIEGNEREIEGNEHEIEGNERENKENEPENRKVEPEVEGDEPENEGDKEIDINASESSCDERSDSSERDMAGPDSWAPVDGSGGGKEKEASKETKPAAVETDEDMASQLAEQWAQEAEEWEGPSNTSREIEVKSEDDKESRTEQKQEEDRDDLTKFPTENGENLRQLNQKADKAEEMDELQPAFQPVVVDGSDLENVHHSFGAVHEASHKLTVMYSDHYTTHMIRYIEEWDKAVSSRVHGRLLEFDRLKVNLEHYVQKVDGMRTNIKKKEGRNQRVSPKTSQRFDRNELKLGGAREAYESYGESLLLLLEEVTDRAWRDCFPLLKRMMLFDMNFSADQARVFSALNETVEMLENLGVGREVDPEGRIRALKEMKPEEIYTGMKYVVPPVHSTRDVYEV